MTLDITPREQKLAEMIWHDNPRLGQDLCLKKAREILARSPYENQIQNKEVVV